MIYSKSIAIFSKGTLLVVIEPLHGIVLHILILDQGTDRIPRICPSSGLMPSTCL
jgi:hypothetical protein